VVAAQPAVGVTRSLETGATWELRFGPNNRFRVLYEVDGGEQIVWVLAVGIKEGKLWPSVKNKKMNQSRFP
jgi:hypothetical protein